MGPKNDDTIVNPNWQASTKLVVCLFFSCVPQPHPSGRREKKTIKAEASYRGIPLFPRVPCKVACRPVNKEDKMVSSRHLDLTSHAHVESRASFPSHGAAHIAVASVDVIAACALCFGERASLGLIV